MDKVSSKRPFFVTLFAVWVLTFAVFHAFGVWEAVRLWPMLQTLPLVVPPAYLVFKNLLWAGVGFLVGVGLWRGRCWGWVDAHYAAGAYAVWYWVDRLFLAPSSMIEVRWPFVLLVTLVGLTLAFGTLRSSAGRRYFACEESPKKADAP